MNVPSFLFSGVDRKISELSNELQTLGGGDALITHVDYNCFLDDSLDRGDTQVIWPLGSSIGLRDISAPRSAPSNDTIKFYDITSVTKLSSTQKNQSIYFDISLRISKWLLDGFNAAVIRYGQKCAENMTTLLGHIPYSENAYEPPSFIAEVLENLFESKDDGLTLAVSVWSLHGNQVIDLCSTNQQNQMQHNWMEFVSVECPTSLVARKVISAALSRLRKDFSKPIRERDEAHLFIRVLLHQVTRGAEGREDSSRISHLHLVHLIGTSPVDTKEHQLLEEEDRIARRDAALQLLSLTKVLAECRELSRAASKRQQQHRNSATADKLVKITSARESKLTLILAPILQGNTKSWVFLYLKDGEKNYSQSLHSLQALEGIGEIVSACHRVYGIDKSSLNLKHASTVLPWIGNQEYLGDVAASQSSRERGEAGGAVLRDRQVSADLDAPRYSAAQPHFASSNLEATASVSKSADGFTQLMNEFNLLMTDVAEIDRNMRTSAETPFGDNPSDATPMFRFPDHRNEFDHKSDYESSDYDELDINMDRDMHRDMHRDGGAESEEERQYHSKGNRDWAKETEHTSNADVSALVREQAVADMRGNDSESVESSNPLEETIDTRVPVLRPQSSSPKRINAFKGAIMSTAEPHLENELQPNDQSQVRQIDAIHEVEYERDYGSHRINDSIMLSLQMERQKNEELTSLISNLESELMELKVKGDIAEETHKVDMMRLQAQLRRISSGTSLDDALQYFESDLIRVSKENEALRKRNIELESLVEESFHGGATMNQVSWSVYDGMRAGDNDHVSGKEYRVLKGRFKKLEKLHEGMLTSYEELRRKERVYMISIKQNEEYAKKVKTMHKEKEQLTEQYQSEFRYRTDLQRDVDILKEETYALQQSERTMREERSRILNELAMLRQRVRECDKLEKATGAQQRFMSKHFDSSSSAILHSTMASGCADGVSKASSKGKQTHSRSMSFALDRRGGGEGVVSGMAGFGGALYVRPEESEPLSISLERALSTLHDSIALTSPSLLPLVSKLGSEIRNERALSLQQRQSLVKRMKNVQSHTK